MPSIKSSKVHTEPIDSNSVQFVRSEDLRQAYEHLGRFEILEGGLSGSDFSEVNALANLAQQQIDCGHGKNAIILLRAAEHLSFAALAPTNSANLLSRIPLELKAAVLAEVERLTHSAEEQWSQTQKADNRTVIHMSYQSSLDRARNALTSGAYRPALQFARAAEALSQIAEGLPASLPGDRELTRRMAS